MISNHKIRRQVPKPKRPLPIVKLDTAGQAETVHLQNLFSPSEARQRVPLSSSGICEIITTFRPDAGWTSESTVPPVYLQGGNCPNLTDFINPDCDIVSIPAHSSRTPGHGLQIREQLFVTQLQPQSGGDELTWKGVC